jgi:hypothetical protein
MDSDASQISVDAMVYLDGGSLTLDFSSYEVTSGTELTLISAETVSGEFESVTADGYKISITYNSDSIVAYVESVE